MDRFDHLHHGEHGVYERLSRLETLSEIQAATLTEIRDEIRKLVIFRAGLLGISAFISAIVGFLVTLLAPMFTPQ